MYYTLIALTLLDQLNYRTLERILRQSELNLG